MQDADRGVSSVVGYALILGIAILGVTLVVVLGGMALTDIQQSAHAQQAGVAMSQFDAQAAQVALGGSAVQTVDLGSAGGQVHVETDAGQIRLEKIDGGTTETLVNTSLGAVVYDTGETTIAYQGGGVWRNGPSGSTMVSPPEYHYRGQTLTFPLIRVTGDDWSGSPGTGLQIRRNGSTQVFPNATTGRLNPLETGHVRVTVTSDYHRGWASYFRTRTDGTVHHYPSNRTVMVNLTVPFQVSFDNAVAATEAGSDAITTNGNAEFAGPKQRNTSHPPADYRIENRIAACESGGCWDLSANLSDGTLTNGTYYEDGDITIGPDKTTYNTSDGPIDVVVNGDLTFTGQGGPGTSDHVITGGNRVTFYVKGNVEITGNGAVNTGGNPNDLLVLVHTDAGSVTAASGTPQFTGYIYAPGSDLTINGGGACGNNGPPGGGGGGGGPPGSASISTHGTFQSVAAIDTEVLAETISRQSTIETMAPPSCDGNIVGGVVVNTATAKGGGKLQYEKSLIDFGLASGTEITYLHVSEQRVTVEGG